MATEQKLFTVSINANADLSAKQYYILALSNSSGEARVAVAGVDDYLVGVLQNVPAAAGRAAEVAVAGISKVVLGGSVTAGDKITADSAGKGITNGSGDAYTIGKALASGSSGDIIPVLLNPVGTA